MAQPGELRPCHDLWLLKAVLREALRDLEEDINPPNIVAIQLEQRMHALRHGLADPHDPVLRPAEGIEELIDLKIQRSYVKKMQRMLDGVGMRNPAP